VAPRASCARCCGSDGRPLARRRNHSRFGNFRPFSGIVEPTHLRCGATLVAVCRWFEDFRTPARSAVSLTSAHHAPLSCTGVLHLTPCVSGFSRADGESTVVLGQNRVALASLSAPFGPQSDADMRHRSHSPREEPRGFGTGGHDRAALDRPHDPQPDVQENRYRHDDISAVSTDIVESPSAVSRNRKNTLACVQAICACFARGTRRCSVRRGAAGKRALSRQPKPPSQPP
jgi:hypothetical protein